MGMLKTKPYIVIFISSKYHYITRPCSFLLEMQFFSLYLETNNPHMLLTFGKLRSRCNNTLATRTSLETKQPPIFSSCHPDMHAGDWLGDACLDIVPVAWTEASRWAAKRAFWSERSAPVSPGIVSQHNATQTCWTPQTDPFVGFSSNAGWGTPMDRKWDFSPNTEGRAFLGRAADWAFLNLTSREKPALKTRIV